MSDGRLFWIQDAYTTTDRYPYATDATRGVNYIRNSVKVVIDAYNGTTTFYLAQPRGPADPDAAGRVPRSAPAARRDAGRISVATCAIPKASSTCRPSVYSTYHMTSPAIFYNKEDQWEVPAIERGGESIRMEPYYTLMTLPGESRPEFIQMLPFTPRRRDNLASWMVARSDGEHYGKIQVLPVPEAETDLRPAPGRGAHQPGPGDLAADHACGASRALKSFRAR